MSHKLSADELRYCIEIGSQRQRTNVQNNVRSKQFTHRDSSAIHIQGVLGEYGFAQLCNREWNAHQQDTKHVLDNTDSRGAKHDTFDWTLFGQKIDVKTTLSANANRMYVRAHKSKNPADWYVLMLIEFLNPKTQQPYTLQSNEYDDYIVAIQRNPDQFQVRVTFHGAVNGSNMFDMLEHHGAVGTVSAPVAVRSWLDFCSQFKSIVDLFQSK